MADDDNTYDIGDEATLVATFRNAAGALANPDPVLFRYKEPDGTLVTKTQWTAAVPGPDIVNISPGVFSAKIAITKSGGFYAWHWLGKGAVPAAKESDADTALKVRTSGFPAA